MNLYPGTEERIEQHEADSCIRISEWTATRLLKIFLLLAAVIIALMFIFLDGWRAPSTPVAQTAKTEFKWATPEQVLAALQPGTRVYSGMHEYEQFVEANQ